jgi:YD repeat-containing protein
LAELPKLKRGYFLRRGWKDLLFLIVLAFLAHWLYRIRYPLPRTIEEDVARWKARPELNLGNVKTTSPPCLFIALSSEPAPPVPSGTIADCLALIPRGVPMNLVEIDLSQGDLIPVKTDLYLEGKMPLAFTRTYFRPEDYFKRNGSSIPHVYDPYLTGSRYPYTYVDWTLPDHRHVHMTRVSAGTEYADNIDEADSSAPREFAGARLGWDGAGWALALPDGTTYLSPDGYNATRPQQGSLIAIFDKDGNEIRLNREQNGDLREIRSPEGHVIRLSYADGRLAGLEASPADRVTYEYDSRFRPATVKYSSGQTIRYVFDDNNFITDVESPPGKNILHVGYDSRSFVVSLTLGESPSYSIRYGPLFKNAFQYADVTAPDSSITHVDLTGSKYTVSH